jgi:23S rRNA pseudouridine1911/1915/1917 synthase
VDDPPGGEAEELRFVAEEDASRIDALLAELAQLPRAQVRRWIDEGRVSLAGRVCRPSQRVAAGQEIVATPPAVVSDEALPEAIPLVVVHEDADLIVIDKPAGMVVHPAPGHLRGTLVNALLHHCDDLAGVGGVLRPGIVHRLDKGTSGIIVVAKNDAAHAGLSSQFHDHTILRRYRAFVRAVPGADSGRVDRPIGRHPRDRKRMSIKTMRGREAHTAWQVRSRYPRSGASDLAVSPETGRTHQIRVHLASAGMPILGDPVYGKPRKDGKGPQLTRPALHAELLGFIHPISGSELRFESPLPYDLAELVRTFEAAESAA